MNILQSEKHEIYGMRVTKKSLSPIDTKSWIADDGVNTSAYWFIPPLSEEMLEFINELINNELKIAEQKNAEQKNAEQSNLINGTLCAEGEG